MGPVQKEKRTLNKLELIKINRKARNLLTKFMPRRSIWKGNKTGSGTEMDAQG